MTIVLTCFFFSLPPSLTTTVGDHTFNGGEATDGNATFSEGEGDTSKVCYAFYFQHKKLRTKFLHRSTDFSKFLDKNKGHIPSVDTCF